MTDQHPTYPAASSPPERSITSARGPGGPPAHSDGLWLVTPVWAGRAVVALGTGFTWDSENITEDQAVAQEAWARAKAIIQAGKHRLVVLDEITYPMMGGWIDTDDVVATIRDRPEQVSVVATGRDAPAALIDVADTVTEMRKIKHAYDAGIVAKKGIDF